MKEKRVVCLVAAGCDILRALGCIHLLVGHDHVPCDAGDLGGLEIITESATGEMQSISECGAAKQAMEALLWEAHFGRVGTPGTMVEWALAPHRRVILPKLRELKPDIIITQHQMSKVVNATCVEAALEVVLGRKVDVVRLDLRRLDGVWEGIIAIMQKLSLGNESFLKSVQDRIRIVQGMCRGRPKKNVAYLQWDTSLVLPFGSEGAGMWVWDAIELVGGINSLLEGKVFNESESEEKLSNQYMDLGSISSLSPDVLILSNPKWGLKELYHKVEADNQLIKHLRSCVASLHLVVVHGPAFLSRPSPSLLVKSIEALCEILYPECQPFGHEGSLWTTATHIFANVT